jgi:heme exporter protein C
MTLPTGRLFHFASPSTFYPLAEKLQPWFAALALLLAAAGCYIGFIVAPTDAQQGEGYRIIFVHVPASWMAMFIYCVMAFWAAVGLAFNIRLAGDDGVGRSPPPARSSRCCRSPPAHSGASRCGAPGGSGTHASRRR